MPENGRETIPETVWGARGIQDAGLLTGSQSDGRPSPTPTRNVCLTTPRVGGRAAPKATDWAQPAQHDPNPPRWVGCQLNGQKPRGKKGFQEKLSKASSAIHRVLFVAKEGDGSGLVWGDWLASSLLARSPWGEGGGARVSIFLSP